MSVRPPPPCRTGLQCHTLESRPRPQAALSQLLLIGRSVRTHRLAERIREITAVVIFPLVVPAVVLALYRADPGVALADVLSIGDVAFGFLSLALAGTVRALALKTDAWSLTATFAAFVALVQVVIAVGTDTFLQQARAMSIVGTIPPRQPPSADQWELLRHELVALGASAPSAWQWCAVVISGAPLAMGCVYLIWRDR